MFGSYLGSDRFQNRLVGPLDGFSVSEIQLDTSYVGLVRDGFGVQFQDYRITQRLGGSHSLFRGRGDPGLDYRNAVGFENGLGFEFGQGGRPCSRIRCNWR